MKFPSLEEGPPKVRNAGGEGLYHASEERVATQKHWGTGSKVSRSAPPTARTTTPSVQCAALRRPVLRLRTARPACGGSRPY